jgi:membrane associated rhomboid family serine protease
MRTFTDDILAEFKKTNNVTNQLLLLNVAVWVFLAIIGVLGHFGLAPFAEFMNSLFILPATLDQLMFRPWTILLYAFTHFGFRHILFNLLALFWFGRMLQDLIGSNRVLGIYILSGLTGGIAYVVFAVILQLIPSGMVGLVGASGSVLGVVVAMATLSPNYKINMMFIGPVAVKWIAAVFVFLSFVGLSGGNAGGDIAHLGGALMGFIFITQLNNGNDLGRPIVDFIYAIPNLFKKKSKMKVTYRSSKKSTSTQVNPSTNGVSQEEIDRILDKISQSGYPSLTKEEKDKLFKYSNK